MHEERLTIWCNALFPPEPQSILERGAAGHTLLLAPARQASNLTHGAADPQLQLAQVILGQPDPAALPQLDKLRWVHLTSAGYERYDRQELRAALGARAVVVTNSSGVYDEPCAEHALAMMLMGARRLGDALDEQRGQRCWPAAQIRAHSHLLAGQSVLILGYGAIARRLIELLAPFRMKLAAVRRRVEGNETVPTYPTTEVDRLIPEADHVVNILPGGESTAGFMDARRLSLMKPSAFFYNIGRGSTVDQAALAAALDGQRIAGACLDVTTPEPLPPDHPLWRSPRCWITPHTAGGAADEHVRLVEHFLGNLALFTRGKPLQNRVI